jgi:hypothetical protein
MIIEFVGCCLKLIKISPHTRLKKTQPPPTMDRIFFVIVDELVCCATNEPTTSLSNDQLESSIVRSWEKLFQSKHYKQAILFAPPQSDQFNYFLFGPSSPSQEG